MTALHLSYLRGDIVHVLVSPLSYSVFSLPGEVVYVLSRLTSNPQAGRDVIYVLGGLDGSAPVGVIMLVGQDRGWDVVHILWYGRLVVVCDVVVVRELGRNFRLDLGKVWWYVVRLLSDWLSIRDVFTNRWREVVNLRRERNLLNCLKGFVCNKNQYNNIC